jgi:hypothetical protein
MSRAAARFTQTEIARVWRMAKEVGGAEVAIQRDGTIIVRPATTPPQDQPPVERKREIVL